MLLLVPLVYLIVSLGLIQGQSLGAEGRRASHRAGTVDRRESGCGAPSADLILRSVIDEYTLDPGAVDVAFECRPAGTTCPEAGSTLVRDDPDARGAASRTAGAGPRSAGEHPDRGLRRARRCPRFWESE
jgi:hypothetical protein